MFPRNKFNIVTVSRVSNAEKRIDWIPWICKSLVDYGIIDFHWYIVGYVDDLNDDVKITKSLYMEGYVTFADKTNNPFQVLKNANMFVLPTRSESFGLAVVEALILHIPVVVCQYPALSEIFEDGKYGLVAEHSIESVVENIKCLIEHKEKYSRIKKNCGEYVFSNDVAYNQFLMATEGDK